MLSVSHADDSRGLTRDVVGFGLGNVGKRYALIVLDNGPCFVRAEAELAVGLGPCRLVVGRAGAALRR